MTSLDAGGHLADSGAFVDAGRPPVDSGGAVDAGAVRLDAGVEDAGRVDGGGSVAAPGFGTISGDCGEVSAELSDAAPSLFENHIDFANDPFDLNTDLSQLTIGGQEIIADGNAGGSSVLSEVFSYEVLARCEGALLLKTETEVRYDQAGKITDLLVEIDGEKVGVSVTRAVGFPRDAPYTIEQARALLEDKLSDILISSANVSAEDAWVKQVLHVVAYAEQHAESVRAAWAQVDSTVRADTIVLVTVTDGDDAFIY